MEKCSIRVDLAKNECFNKRGYDWLFELKNLKLFIRTRIVFTKE